MKQNCHCFTDNIVIRLEATMPISELMGKMGIKTSFAIKEIALSLFLSISQLIFRDLVYTSKNEKIACTINHTCKMRSAF